ncbi:magnetosome biogenesis transporter MamZ [Magnetovibrio sp. PR-2]|uniref:magnetosome biogenesis transporter MamZ n=1 Tax=Magnetovibrio sp. PR-2 TaxID=3120356 RepID=UPI002FCDF14A
MAHRPVEQWRWNALYLLLALSSVIMTLMVGLQPLYLTEVIGLSDREIGSINATIQISAETAGLLLIAYLGYISDRIRRRKIIFFGFILAAIGATLAPFSMFIGDLIGTGALGFYLMMRIVVFLGMGAVWPLLITLAGDYTEFEERPRQMSKAFFMMTFGGAVIYAILMQATEEGGVYAAMFIPAVLAMAGVKLSRNKVLEVAPILNVRQYPWERVRAIFSDDPRMQLSFISAFFSRSDMVFIGIFLMMWMVHDAELVGISAGDAASQAALLLGVMGMVMLVAIPIWGRFIEHFGRVTAIAGGMAFSALGFLMLGVVSDPFGAAVLVPAILVGVGQAGCLVAPQVLAMDLSPKDLRGTMLGMFYMMGGIGVVFFVQGGGMLYDTVGPHAPFVLIGIGNLLVMTLALSLRITDTGQDISPKRKKIGFKPVVFVICLMPVLVPLIWFVDNGGVISGSAIGGLPLGYWNRYLGDWALNFLIISLALRPLREMSKAGYLARYNRMIGLYAFFYAALHVVTYVWLEWDLSWSHMWTDFFRRYFILFGLVAFVVLTVLAVTSSKDYTKRLGGKVWKQLHRSIYAVNVLVIVHFLLSANEADVSITRSLIYTALVAFLLGYRLRQFFQKRSRTAVQKTP